MANSRTHAFGIADKTRGFAVADPPRDRCGVFMFSVYDSCAPCGGGAAPQIRPAPIFMVYR